MKNVSYKAASIFEYYNFSLGHLSIKSHLKNFKKMNLNIINLKIEFLGPKQFKMKKVVNCKVAGLFEYYNFGLGSFSAQGHNLKVEFEIVNT